MKKEGQLPSRKCKTTFSPPTVTRQSDSIYFKIRTAYNDRQFLLLAVARLFFYLATLEATVHQKQSFRVLLPKRVCRCIAIGRLPGWIWDADENNIFDSSTDSE